MSLPHCHPPPTHPHTNTDIIMEMNGGGGTQVRQFLEHLTNNVVLCVMSSELGEVEVETTLARLCSWSIESLVAHSSVNYIVCGEKICKENGEVIHTMPRPATNCHNPLEDKCWAAVHFF